MQSSVERGPLRITVRATPAAPRLSDLVEITIELWAVPEVEVEAFPELSELPGLILRDYDRELPSDVDNGVMRRTVYTFEPDVSGTITVPELEFAFTDPRPNADQGRHTVLSEPLEITVQTVVPEDVIGLDALQPAAAPLALERPPIPWLRYGAVAIVVVAGLVLLAWRLRRRKPKAALVVSLHPKDRAVRDLEQLATEHLFEKQEYKLYYVRLTGILRQFIEDTTGVHAPEQTTEEFLRAIHGHPAFDRKWRNDLGAFLESADLVKFAAQLPQSDESETSMQLAWSFIDRAPGTNADEPQEAAA